MEAEDESVKPSENNCDWCGKPCRSEKYCCNKCKHEHAKAERTLSNITKSALVSLRQRIRVDANLCVAIFLLGLGWLLFEGLHLWLVHVNELYMLAVDSIPKRLLQIPESVIPKPLSVFLAFVIRLMPATYLMLDDSREHSLISMLIVCVLSTAVYYWLGQFSFVANCVVLLVGVGCMVLLPLLPPKHK